MKRLIPLLVAVVVLTLGANVALGAEEAMAKTDRVVFVVGGDIEIPAGDQADVVVVIDGDATIAGTVNALVVVDGTATIGDTTVGSVAVVNGTADLSGTRVRDDIYRLNAEIISTDVEVGGTIRDITGDVAAFGLYLGAAAIVLWIGFGLATILVGLLVAGIAARQVRTATTLIRRETGRTFLTGVLAILVPPILAALLMATLVGIPAAFGLLVVVWPAVAFIGYIVAAIWLGEWLLNRRVGAEPPARPYLAAVVGLVVAAFLGLVPLVTAALSILGLGAVVLGAIRTLRGGRRAPAATTAPVPA